MELREREVLALETIAKSAQVISQTLREIEAHLANLADLELEKKNSGS